MGARTQQQPAQAQPAQAYRVVGMQGGSGMQTVPGLGQLPELAGIAAVAAAAQDLPPGQAAVLAHVLRDAMDATAKLQRSLQIMASIVAAPRVSQHPAPAPLVSVPAPAAQPMPFRPPGSAVQVTDSLSLS